MEKKNNLKDNFYSIIFPFKNKIKPISNMSNIYEDVIAYPRVLMRLFGIYHDKNDKIVIKMYSILVLLSQWFLFCKFFTVFKKNETFSGELVLKIVTLLWMLVVILDGCFLFINQEMITKENNLVNHFLDLLHFVKDKYKMKKTIRLKVSITFCIAFCFGLFNSISAIFSLFGPSSFYSAFSGLLSPFENIDSNVGLITYKLAITLIFCYFSLSWTLSIAYFVSHCIIMVELLKDFNKSCIDMIENKVFTLDPSEDTDSNNDNDDYSKIKRIYLCSNDKKLAASEKEFEFYRLWHLKLCQCVNKLDNCYNLMIAVTITFYTCIFLLILYTMSDWDGNCIRGIMEILYPFWAFVGAFLMCLMILVSSKINSQVK
jgi:hypothetical protein